MTFSQGAILILIGTKAQFIKTAPILREFDRRGTGYRLVYTGQHRETFDALERAFGTRPADDLMVHRDEADSFGGLAAWGVRFVRAAIARRREWRGARWGIVHGDTARAPTAGLHGYPWPERPECYDYFFVTEDLAERVKVLDVLSETAASDHQPVVLELA